MIGDVPRDQVLVIAAEGSRVRRAVETLTEAGPSLAGAFRRAIPFIGRSAMPVVVRSVNAAPIEKTLATLAKPWHQTALVIEPGGSAGLLAFDGCAVATVLDGLLGGDGKKPSPLTTSNLTTTQMALMARVATGVCAALSEALSRIGLSLAPRGKNAPDAHGETAPITCTIEIGEGENVGRVLIAIAKDALVSKSAGISPKKETTEKLDSRIVSTLVEVEVELVAELGHARMRIAELASLQPGATLRLDAPISGSVGVMAQGHCIFSGRPTAINGQIAVRLDRHEG